MHKLVLFNNKGGVGKTSLTVNIADALGDLGHKVLLIDADPQCNLTSYYLSEGQIDGMLNDSDDDDDGATLRSSIKPIVRGRGGIHSIPTYQTPNSNVVIAPGDVLLADYEEELPDAWTRSFARNERGYDVTRALSDAVAALANANDADIVIYDVGPNVGPLNRVVLLDSDFFGSSRLLMGAARCKGGRWAHHQASTTTTACCWDSTSTGRLREWSWRWRPGGFALT